MRTGLATQEKWPRQELPLKVKSGRRDHRNKVGAPRKTLQPETHQVLMTGGELMPPRLGYRGIRATVAYSF